MANASDYENHLAAAVLNDGRIISYRLLSRELNVHSNTAKRMLFEFHRKQTAKKPGSIHATYLLDGAPKPIVNVDQMNAHPRDGDDLPMQSSPSASSAMQEEEKGEEYAVPARSIILAREEDLAAAKSKFETIHSIHVYSLQPNTLQNLQVLSDCNRIVSANFNSQDPLIVGQRYGVIHNNSVRRRTVRRPPLGVAPSVSAVKKEAKATPKIAEENKANHQASNPSTQDSNIKSEKPSSSRPTTKASSKVPTLKKEHSDIFKSFSKSKPPLKKETSDSSAINSPAPPSQVSAGQTEDEAVRNDDDKDDDQEEDTYIPANNKADPNARTVRYQRAEELRKMMDDDDDDDNQSKDEDEDDEMPDVDKEPPPISTSPDLPNQKSPTPEPPPVISNGRRRGRRKIMKKKTIKDEEGYLVTKEEPAWESFSEEERAPVSSSSIVGGGKGKKTGGSASGGGGGGKVGQGNIMSFFGKR